jgi:hypothetical protein
VPDAQALNGGNEMRVITALDAVIHPLQKGRIAGSKARQLTRSTQAAPEHCRV